MQWCQLWYEHIQEYNDGIYELSWLPSLLERSVRVMDLGLFVCLSVCLSVCPDKKLKNYCSDWLDFFELVRSVI